MLAAGLWIVIAFAVVAVLGERAVHRRFPFEILKEMEQPAGELFMSAGSGLYGVLVAFVLSAALNNFERLREAAGDEVDSLANLASIAAGLPAPAGPEIRAGLVSYVQALLGEERLTKGTSGGDATAALRTVRGLIVGFKPRDEGETNLHATALDLINHASDHRRTRLIARSNGLPGSVWALLLFGGIHTMTISMFNAIRPARVRALLVAGLATLIASSLIVIYVLHLPHPFIAEVSHRFQELLASK